LGENAQISSIEITKTLKDLEYIITEIAVRYEIKNLEKD
jgi:repressor of nif and glnA expression